jgi:hypothetical protein
VPGGLPELFAPQPAEVATPTDAQSRALLDFWRERNPDTGELRFTFTDEAFDGRLMGDLYQDLDPVVKARFALVQTPDFVLDFMLDETLTPAIAEFGVHEVRVLDPACGSGHFLLAAFKRLVAALREAEPSWAPEQLVAHVLPRVVGIDLNDYACGLARARLVMTALDVLGSKDLAAASGLHPQVFWADGLEQLERDDLGQISFGFATEDEKPQATLSQPEVRAKLRPVLKAGFHVVVANPPYITEKDAQRRAYHRETVGKTRRYLSASRTYSLGNPFTERMFQLCVDGGYVGDFNANSFMKREFGRSLIEEVLAKYKLTKVIDTSGAYFPSYGTPTVLLFGRRKAFDGSPVVVVGGKRGEPGKPANAALGHVWRSIVQHHATPHFENDFVSVRGVEAETMRTHPWNVGGGGAVALQSALEEGGETKLSMHSEAIGRTTVLGEDGAWILPRAAASRCSLTPDTLPFVVGENCRDWSLDVTAMEFVVYPYELVGRLPTLSATAAAHLWPRRRLLQGRSVFGKRIGEKTGHWWLHLEHYTDKLRAPLSLTFAFKATHNHFALDRGGKVFNRTAPVIKLPAGATEEQHLALLGQLNSSAACFWLKQVCQSMGAQGVNEGIRHEKWDQFYEHDGTKLQSFPVAAPRHELVEELARAIEQLARGRQARSILSVIDESAAAGSAALRAGFDTRSAADLRDLAIMVALQEELDWLCYELYGIDVPAATERRAPDALPPLIPGQRPFELTLAREDSEKRADAERGEPSDEPPTAWFTRHGWEPVTDIASLPEGWRAVTAARLARTAESLNLQLIEQPQFKRRWYRPDFQQEEQAAMRTWLADRLEEASKAFTTPFTPRQLAAALQDDPALEAVATLYAGQGFDLDALVATLLFEESVPNTKHHVYKAKSLAKRAAWEKTWRLQHEEDVWDAQKARHDAAIAAGHRARQRTTARPRASDPCHPLPPKYTSADFLRSEAWQHRGKLDVPKERFVAFSEVPEALNHAGSLYGWAGWTHRKRAEVLMALDEQAEHAGATLPERYALLYAVQSLLPYVRWDESAHGLADEYQGILGDLLGDAGVTETMLNEWASQHPPPSPPRKASAPKAAKNSGKKTASKPSEKPS